MALDIEVLIHIPTPNHIVFKNLTIWLVFVRKCNLTNQEAQLHIIILTMKNKVQFFLFRL